MNDTTWEKFTAQEAISSGLAEAIKRGEVTLSGSYELKDAGMTYKQAKFSFMDSAGKLRSGWFENSAELQEFFRQYRMAV